MNQTELWQRFCRYWCRCEPVGLTLDVSRMTFPDDYLPSMARPLAQAFEEMAALEAGAIANPDERRMVGHYWLRAPELAPQVEIRRQVEECRKRIKAFAADVHAGRIAPPGGGRFTGFLLVGIGGSALGPQLLADALGGPHDRMRAFFLDNTDPDGIDRTLAAIGPELAGTLTIVISKSGGTKETRNGMVETARAYAAAGLDFARHAVAITAADSELDRHAHAERWLDVFPMWDWVGGRTSITSAVGLLPAALLGADIDALLDGAARMDAATRRPDAARNPAAWLTLMWYYAADRCGLRDMVVLPYKDRLILFSRYLQQLVMESLGKGMDRAGRPVAQGLAVYGNKGSTDQHAYVQQLREGLSNFFVTFIRVLRDRGGPSLEVEPGVTSGDYLHGFLLGTREALYENGRQSMTITVDEVTPRTLGALIALYERAVGLYASLVNINAYHQPGVEAGKKAAGAVIALQGKVLAQLRARSGEAQTAAQIAQALDRPGDAEVVYLILEHLAADPARGITRTAAPAPTEARYAAGQPAR